MDRLELKYSPFAFDMLMALFREIELEGVEEYVFEQVIDRGPVQDRYSIRIYSTINKSSNKSSTPTPTHAARLPRIGHRFTLHPIIVPDVMVAIYDLKLGKLLGLNRYVVPTSTNYMEQIKEKARELYRYVLVEDRYCPYCSSLLIEKFASDKNKVHGKKSGIGSSKRKFLACTSYPQCKFTRNADDPHFSLSE